ncbi:hypothetical protein SARC_00081 [Sphaeroforma arctica JP610]|uniref:GH26 domain-containing protein n=1 Tax=Sphaeroforma arctica JP610 TaxID=667725 RepID=A0A0L0GG32_9EUKA|nr:hypothetical protein SARC_00081 [Sphaeroforma arctica JP610]KNC87824.1 hypothetical protein SARC_00081 [Sphaeroforma arctica JP610]|eukprot:XP_014161726.1 hypothetical protein SARC_00081 [Sphaeroforma arctica JP610]
MLLIVFAFILILALAGIVATIAVLRSGSATPSSTEPAVAAAAAAAAAGGLTSRACVSKRRMPRIGLGVYAGQEAKGLNAGFEWRYYTMAELSPTTRGEYDWSTLEKDLAGAHSRGRPMVVRIQDQSGTNSGDDNKSLLPSYVSQPNKVTVDGFVGVDWSSADVQQFELDFFTAFAAKFDKDTRIAFLQVGWGFWSESHLYHDGKDHRQHGVNYPTKEYQAKFVDHLAGLFKCLTFSFSIDGAFSGLPLDDLRYGVFNDSLTAKGSSSQDTYYKQLNFAERNKTQPSGGEFPDSIKTPFGEASLLERVKQYNVQYVFANQQREDPNWDSAVAAVMQT